MRVHATPIAGACFGLGYWEQYPVDLPVFDELQVAKRRNRDAATN